MKRLIKPVGLEFLERLSKQSYAELFSLWFSLVFVFAVLYFILTVLHPAHGITVDPHSPIIDKLLESLYFSVITATTTGYGDVLPLGFSKALACVQMVTAFGTFGIFLAKLVAEDERALKATPRKTPKKNKKKA